MSEWWTYRLSDFLMFSPTTYWRLVERYNREVWPLQLLALFAGVVLMWLVAVRHPLASRAVSAVLGAVWLWVGWAFHWQRYAPINLAAGYFAVAFAVQAMLLLVLAISGAKRVVPPAGPRTRIIGLALAVWGVLLHPFVALAAGRPLAGAEVFGLMPDPTAAATLGLLLATGMLRRAWLGILPALSLMAGLATLWMLL